MHHLSWGCANTAATVRLEDMYLVIYLRSQGVPNFVFKYFDVKNVLKTFDSGYERSYRAGGNYMQCIERYRYFVSGFGDFAFVHI